MKMKTAKKPKAIESIKDLTPDIGNVNRGTERGNFQLDWSLSEFGAWRSIAASADGVIAAGNQTLQQAADHGLKIRPVHTSGDELVVVIRDDISSDDPRFRQYAIADNRISELNYSPDVEMLLTHRASGVDISPMYRDDELELMKASVTESSLARIIEDAKGAESKDKSTEEPSDYSSLSVPVSAGQEQTIRAGIKKAKTKFSTGHSGEALAKLVQDWLDNGEDS